MSNLLNDIGGGLDAAGSFAAGIGGYVGEMGSASRLQDAAARVERATQVRLLQQDRVGYQVQGKTLNNIGANGGTIGGSAEDIIRMNAQNLALDHGIIQQQGSEQASQYTSAASQAEDTGLGDLIGGVVKGAATLALL